MTNSPARTPGPRRDGRTGHPGGPRTAQERGSRCGCVEKSSRCRETRGEDPHSSAHSLSSAWGGVGLGSLGTQAGEKGQIYPKQSSVIGKNGSAHMASSPGHKIGISHPAFAAPTAHRALGASLCTPGGVGHGGPCRQGTNSASFILCWLCTSPGWRGMAGQATV